MKARPPPFDLRLESWALRDPKTANQMREIVAQVADLAGVDDEHFLPFSKELLVTIASFEGVDSKRGKALLKAESALIAAREAILALDKRDQVRLRRAFISFTISGPKRRERITICSPKSQFARKRIWTHAPDELFWAFRDLTFVGREHPKGAIGNRELQMFIELLWFAAKLYSGNLYADHKRNDGGTMIRALELLRPVLPESLLPKVLPVYTIETVIKNFKVKVKSSRVPPPFALKS